MHHKTPKLSPVQVHRYSDHTHLDSITQSLPHYMRTVSSHIHCEVSSLCHFVRQYQAF